MGLTYYLHHNHDGKRVWESARDDPSLALVALQRKTVELQASALGMALPATHVPTEPGSTPSVIPIPTPVRYRQSPPSSESDWRPSLLLPAKRREMLVASWRQE